MSEWHRIADQVAFDGREMIPAKLGARHVLVYRTRTGLFATDRRCTHQGGDLLRGYLDGDVIECPVHQGRFNIRTGAALNAPACEPLVTYPVRVRDGKIEIELI